METPNIDRLAKRKALRGLLKGMPLVGYVSPSEGKYPWTGNLRRRHANHGLDRGEHLVKRLEIS